MINGINAFVDKYAEINKISKAKSKEEILRFVETFKACTIENGGVDITGFIKSEVIDVPEREYRNPKTNEKGIKPKTKKIKVSARPTFAKMLED